MNTLGELAARQAQRYGEKPLFFSGEEIVSYRAFHDRTDRLADALSALGIGKGDRLAVLLGNGLEIVEIYMAAAKCGAVSIPLNTMFTPREIAYVVNNSGASILITASEHVGRLEAMRGSAPSLKHIVAIGERVASALCWEDVVASGTGPPLVEVAGGDVAMTLYTSGTTGHPKGAMLTHDGLLHNARAVVEAVGFCETDRSLCILPLFHLFAIAFDYLQMMTAGASTVIVGRFEAGEALELIERRRVTVLVGVPTMFIYLLDHPERKKRDLSSLRIGDTGGGPVPQSLKAAWKQEVGMTLIESYGLTEASPAVSIERPEKPRREGSCGQPLPGMETRVVDHDNQDVPCGEPGELLVRGPNVMRGYFEMPEATAQTVVDGWLHTGDLVRMDRDGYLYMIDRIKHMIICGGYNIYPKEIENILHAHPKVLECAVIGVTDPVKGEIPKACVVLRRGAHTTEQEIKDYCREALAAYKVPRVVEFMESLPKTATGKIRKVELVGGANSLAPK